MREQNCWCIQSMRALNTGLSNAYVESSSLTNLRETHLDLHVVPLQVVTPL